MSNRMVGEDVFRKIVEEATDFAIIILDVEGTVRSWNAGAENIFSWRAEEVVGRPFGELFLPADRAAGMPERELESARVLGRADDSRWHAGKGNRQIFLDGVTTPITDELGTLTGFLKIARDITERQLTERRLAAQLALTNLLDHRSPPDVVARRVLETICQNLGWEIGALWEERADGLRCVDHWSAPHIGRETVRDLCESIAFEPGKGLVGSVWSTHEPLWVSDFSDASRFPRASIAARAGMHAAFAFPVISSGQIRGVMEFFSSACREPEQPLLPTMTLIGGQIGDFFERVRTQEALRASEQRFRLLTETAQDAIFVMDEESIVTFCNPGVTRMLGYEPEELIGRSLEVIIPEHYRAAHRAGVRRYLATRKKHIAWAGIVLPAVHKDGHEVPCEIAFGEWTEGDRTVFTGFARDVTERTRILKDEQKARAEAEAVQLQLERRAEEEEAFRHLASALTGAVEMDDVLHEITNRATQVTRADGVYVERLSLDAQGESIVEVVASAGRGAPPRGLRVPFPGSMTDEMMQGGSPVILTDMSKFGREMAPYLVDSCPNCEVLVAPLAAERETLGALVLLNGASSGRHFREGDIVRARTLGDLTSLALRRVRLMEQERDAKEKAEDAVRVRDETLGIVSHDLRNPLTMIALSAGLLEGAAPEQAAELLETIRTSARQMQRLIQDLLDVARMESSALSVAGDALDPAPLVREMCDSNAPIARQKSQRIVYELEASLPSICGDRDRLVQVFGNLISNAIKFTPEGGVVTVSAVRSQGVVEFVVRDTGPGIPEADLGHIFTPYWQAKKTAHLGAGLGLAIVRGIVEAHGGRVWAQNVAGGGAEFRFTVPVVD